MKPTMTPPRPSRHAMRVGAPARSRALTRVPCRAERRADCAATAPARARQRSAGRCRAMPRSRSTVAPPPARQLFAPPVADVWLEIGFGGGEHLLWQAEHNPTVGLIGCEPFQDGVVKVLSAIDEEQLANIRLHADDARPLLRRLPDGQHRARVHPVSRSLAEGAPPQAPARVRGDAGRACAHHARRGRAAHRHRRWRLCPLDPAGRSSDNGISAGRRPAPPTGASGPPIGRRPATSKRPCKRAAGATISASAGGDPALRQTFHFPLAMRANSAYYLLAHDHLNSESGP